METDFWNNVWMVVVGILSLITSIVAIKIANRANKQVEKQIEISNKQFVFERRLKAYKLLTELLESFSQFIKIEDFTSEIDKNIIDLQINSLINNNYFSYGGVLFFDERERRVNLINKLSDLVNDAKELEFIFENKEIIVVSIFFVEFGNHVSYLKTCQSKLEKNKKISDEEVNNILKSKISFMESYSKIINENIVSKISNEISLTQFNKE